ncbi:MAG TPA: GNAT family N-acetyltransferase [Caulobacteraceae bacterium]|nr:GNAT family N-acetyltransferase [Caulobacteraceae bacterium]
MARAPAPPQITLEPTPSDADMRLLGEKLNAYNEAHAGPLNFERVFLSVRDADGALVGGLLGATYWGWLFVSVLFVDEALRGTGVGGELLSRAEALGLERGVTHVYLDTFSFQAGPFYAARGYAVFGTLDDFPAGHRRMWMSKALRAP